MRALLIAILALLWLLLGWLYYKDYNKCCVQKQVIPTLEKTERTGPLLFLWGSSAPILGESWPRMRDSLTALVSATTKLEISGWYCTNAAPDETDSTAYKRALETRKLFTNLTDDQVVILTKSVTCDSSDVGQKIESVSFASRIYTENIKEIDDKTLIYFPPNSTNKLNSAEVEKYLDDVAERVLKSSESVNITGHTDNVGDATQNLKLGQKRADVVAKYLISKGVQKEKLIVSSKGEETPIADNDTADGKAKNRRTELQIIK
ncbi:MAG TPA: OmpA family protein [Saprospiraceae bacterium]|nr:OmpA family protein [Saprospiraceae bacterium]